VLNPLQLEILKSRYALPTENTWEDVVNRVVQWVVNVESPDKQQEVAEQFHEVMDDMLFVPGGRVLYGAGRSRPQLLNCFAFQVEDNAQSIGKLLHDVYITSVNFGGCGINYSRIRPKGDALQGMHGQAPGVISEMRKIDCIGNEVKAGGARRAALIGLLHISHPDVLEFLKVKLDLGELTNHNISIIINDEFLKAAKQKKPWVFKFSGREYRLYKVRRTGYRNEESGWKRRSDEIEVIATDKKDAVIRADVHYRIDESDKFTALSEREIGAHEILEILAENAHKSGEPGIINEDLIKRNFTTWYFEKFASVNPCTEALLPNLGNCCLGSVNLLKMYDPKTNDVNWKLLAKAIRAGVRFLDNVLTVNQYPLDEMRAVSHNSRRIGLGVMGLAHLLIKMGMRYGSDQSLEFVDRLMKTIRDESFRASIRLAKEKGAFERFDPDRHFDCDFIQALPPDVQEEIEEHGIRNAVILSIAPTGTISMLAGCSSGIEPIFAAAFKRRFRKDGTIVERIVIDPLFKELFRAEADTVNCVGAHQVSAEEHMKMIARVQQWIDQSISKTTNVAENTTPESIARYILKYGKHIKGWTIYREGSRDFGGGGAPLESINVHDMDEDEVKQLIQLAEEGSGQERSCKNGSCDV